MQYRIHVFSPDQRRNSTFRKTAKGWEGYIIGNKQDVPRIYHDLNEAYKQVNSSQPYFTQVIVEEHND